MARTFITDVSGLEMSLALQYYDQLDSIKEQDRNFSRTEKKDHSKHKNGFWVFQLLETVISSASDQIATFWLEVFCLHQLKITFNLELVKLIHY